MGEVPKSKFPVPDVPKIESLNLSTGKLFKQLIVEPEISLVHNLSAIKLAPRVGTLPISGPAIFIPNAY